MLKQQNWKAEYFQHQLDSPAAWYGQADSLWKVAQEN
jgi:hypothetical protein